MKVKYFSLLFLAVLSVIVILGLVSAVFSTGNPSHSIEKRYGQGQGIIGWINVSVGNENVNSLISDSEGNNISIIDLLERNPNVNYSCTPKNCQNDYSASNGQTSKQLTQTAGTTYYGMFFSGELSFIDSISFNVSGEGIGPSCTNQLEIDFFDDGIIDFSNTNADVNVCGGTKSYGCFDISGAYEEVDITSSLLCQKINLTRAPGFRLGAWIKKEGSGNRDMTLTIYKKDGSKADRGECKIINPVGEGESFCDVNYSVQNPEEHYICMSSTQGTGSYKTRGYTENKCGFFGNPPRTETASYNISAQARQFATLKSIGVTDSFAKGTLSFMTEDYLGEKYGNLDCSNNCTVPIKFIANFVPAQLAGENVFDLSISNIKIIQEKGGFGSVTTTQLYDLSEIPGKASSDYGRLYLDNSGLKVRENTGNFSYILSFNEQRIFRETLSVEKAPIIRGLAPLKTSYAFPTEFELNVDYPGNVSRYEWDFEDNSTAATTINKVTHIYDNAGLYNLKVVIKDRNNISSSRTFVIEVTSPKELISSTLEKMKADISKVKVQIDSYDLFYRAGLSNAINISNLNSSVKSLENRYLAASEENYTKIVSDMLKLKVPESIAVSTSAPNLVFYPAEENVNVDVLKEIKTGDYRESDSDYVESIYAWNAENMKNNFTFEEISARYSGISKPILKVFKFTISEKKALDYNSYFVIKNMENLKFKEDYGEQNADGYKYIMLTGGTREIFFSTTEDVNFETLPAFIAPPLSKLAIVGPRIPTEEESDFRWTAFIIAILVLLVIGVIIYIILQKWYRKRYEDYLFKNKNDLYNLFHFIESQRKKGVHESEINDRLKKAGWDSEQIKYSMKKYSGGRTGMLEIPVEKLFEKFDKKEEGHRGHHMPR